MREFKKNKYMLSCMMLVFTFSMVFPDLFWASQAAKNEVIGKFNTFETLFTDIISVLGQIYTLWGISEWGLAWHESNGTMGSQSFKKIFGGLVVVLAPQILAILA